MVWQEIIVDGIPYLWKVDELQNLLIMEKDEGDIIARTALKSLTLSGDSLGDIAAFISELDTHMERQSQ